jgi:hypothetical protein
MDLISYATKGQENLFKKYSYRTEFWQILELQNLKSNCKLR